jgi:hypothetical protein
LSDRPLVRRRNHVPCLHTIKQLSATADTKDADQEQHQGRNHLAALYPLILFGRIHESSHVVQIERSIMTHILRSEGFYLRHAGDFGSTALVPPVHDFVKIASILDMFER